MHTGEGIDFPKIAMKTKLFSVLGVVSLSVVCILSLRAQAPAKGPNHDLGFEDTPILPGLPYHVHDPNRPHPPVVTPGAKLGDPPSDAIVLFDGKDLSKW